MYTKSTLKIQVDYMIYYHKFRELHLDCQTTTW